MVVPQAVSTGASRGQDQPGDIQRPLPAPFGNIKSGYPPNCHFVLRFFAPGVFIGGPVSPLLGFYSVFNYSIHFNTWMQGWEFAYRFSEQIACFLQKN